MIIFNWISKSGCDQKCVEQLDYLMELTGWSRTTLVSVFFVLIFVVLVLITVLYGKYRGHRAKKHKARGYQPKRRKKNRFRRY